MMMKKLWLISLHKLPSKLAFVPDRHNRISFIGSSGSGKAKVLLNLLNHQQPGVDKIYLCVKDPSK